MRGISVTSGSAVSGVAHLRQSIADVLSTPIGSRVMRRDYGSLLPELLDQPATAALRQRVIAAVAGALRRWEPRLKLTKVTILETAPGAWTLALEGVRTDQPRPNAYGRLSLPLRAARASA